MNYMNYINYPIFSPIVTIILIMSNPIKFLSFSLSLNVVIIYDFVGLTLEKKE